MSKKKIIISCGGTGGHIFPALEIADSIKKQCQDVDILFVGAIGKMEMKKVPDQGYVIKGIWMQGYYRKSLFKNLLLPIKIMVSLIHSLCIILYYNPIVVIGTGGFASFPVVYTASFLGFNTYIQEQNCYPGLANRLLGNRMNRVFVAHDGMEEFFPKKKIMNLGNPVRKSLKLDAVSKKESRGFFGLEEDVFTILVIGGSLGAKSINHEIAFFRDIYCRKDNPTDLCPHRCQIIWQTGVKPSYNPFPNRTPGLTYLDVVFGKDENYRVSKHEFIDRMDLAYHAADVVISRAGAIAIAEICYLSKPSILIPSPNVTADHQTINAEYLKNNDAAIVFSEKQIKEDWEEHAKNLRANQFSIGPIPGFSMTCGERCFMGLRKSIDSLINDHKYHKKLGENAHKLFKYNAADDIASIVLKDSNRK